MASRNFLIDTTPPLKQLINETNNTKISVAKTWNLNLAILLISIELLFVLYVTSEKEQPALLCTKFIGPF